MDLRQFLWESNIFLFISVAFGVLLYLQYRRSKTSSRCSNLLRILFCSSVVLFVLLEILFLEKCPVDPVRYNQTLQIFTVNLAALKQMSVKHVVFFGTLLYVLRDSPFGVWDQVCSISLCLVTNAHAALTGLRSDD